MSQESETFPFSCRFDIIGHADEGRHGSRITAKVRQLLATVTQERLTGFRSFPPFLYVVGVIARQEIIANFRNLKIPAAGVVLSSLFVASAHLLGGDYRERLANWTTNQTAQRDPIVGGVVRYELPDGSFFDSVGTGHNPPLLLPPKPLSVLVKGMDGDFHRPIALGQQIQFGPRQDDKTVPLLFEVPDFSFVVKLIVSLLALFFTADSLTREKESGTLRMLSANPLRRRELLLGKSLGASVSLFLSIGAAYAGVMIYLFSFYGIPGSPDESVRSLLIFSLSLLYGVVFLHLGVFISSLTNRTKTATAVALLLWAGLVLIAPNIAVLVAEILSPAATYNQLRARLDEAWRRSVQAELRSNPGAQTIFESANIKEAILRRLESDRQLTDHYLQRRWSQIDLAYRLASLTPTGAFVCSVSDLAGTGRNAYRDFLEFLQSGRNLMADALRRRWDLPPEQGASLLRETESLLRSRKHPPESLRQSVNSALPALASLVLWMSVLGLAAYWRFERYDLR